MILPVWWKPALAAVALSGAFLGGWTVNGWRHEAKQADALREQQAAFQRQLAKQHEIAAEYEAEREAGRIEHHVRENTIREIYRDVPVSPDCEPPADALRVLDEAINAANQRPG